MSTSLWILPFRKVTRGFQCNVFLSNLFITFVCERAGFGVFSHDFDRFCQIYQQNVTWMTPKNLPSIWRSKWWVSTRMGNIGGRLLATQHRGCILMASFSISLHLLSDIGTWITFTIFHHLWIEVSHKVLWMSVTDTPSVLGTRHCITSGFKLWILSKGSIWPMWKHVDANKFHFWKYGKV